MPTKRTLDLDELEREVPDSTWPARRYRGIIIDLIRRLKDAEGTLRDVVEADTRTDMRRVGDAWSAGGFETTTRVGPAAELAAEHLGRYPDARTGDHTTDDGG